MKKDIIIGLTANKSDLFEEQVVPEDEAIQYAKENGFFFFQTSAKQGTGITDLIESLGNEYLKRNGCVERSSFILQKAKTLPRKKKDKCCSIYGRRFISDILTGNWTFMEKGK